MTGMKPSYTQATILGAVIGLVLALGAMLFVGATGGVPKLGVTGEGAGIEPAFSVPTSAMWMVAMVASAVVGLILAVGTRAIVRVLDPVSASTTLWIVAPAGAIVGATLAMAVYPLGVSMLGSLADGNATISVMGMTMLTAILGVVGGAVIVWQSYVMSRPQQAQPDPELLAA
jgi:hypothetical protein